MKLDFEHLVPSLSSHVEGFLFWVIGDAIADIVATIIVRELVLGLDDFHLRVMQFFKVDHFDNFSGRRINLDHAI